MNIDSTSYYGPITTISNNSTTSNYSPNLYSNFVSSLDELKEKDMLMYRLPSDVLDASIKYPGYLTNEELQERQYKGRYWDLCGGYLYILVDNETLVVVDNKDVKIFGREHLPFSLAGRYYYDEY